MGKVHKPRSHRDDLAQGKSISQLPTYSHGSGAMATAEQMQQMYNDFDTNFKDTIKNLESTVAQLSGGGRGGVSGNGGEVANESKG